MNSKSLEDIRRKRDKAHENYQKACDFVKAKETELEDLKKRMVEACSALETDEYIRLLKQIADKETELRAVKDIAEQTGKQSGFTDSDVQRAYSKYCEDHAKAIKPLIKSYNDKKAELVKLYEQMAELQTQAIQAKEECKGYLVQKQTRLETPILIPNCTREMLDYFYSDLPIMDRAKKGNSISQYCGNVEYRGIV